MLRKDTSQGIENDGTRNSLDDGLRGLRLYNNGPRQRDGHRVRLEVFLHEGVDVLEIELVIFGTVAVVPGARLNAKPPTRARRHDAGAHHVRNRELPGII